MNRTSDQNVADTSEVSGGTASNGNRVPAIDRAFAVLGLLRDQGPSTLTEIVNVTKINKSTCLYTLRTLLDHDVVTLDDAHRYGIGSALIEFAHVAASQNEPLVVARRHLAELLEQMDVTIIVYRRLDAGHVALIDKLERLHRVRITVSVGTRLPIQGGSFGRCFLAFDPPNLVDDVLAEGLRQFTPKSVTDVEKFRAELAEVRRQRWAVDRDGFSMGVTTVASPIFDKDGQIELVAAAVGFSSVMTDEICARYGVLLRETCETITRKAGGVVPAIGTDS